MSESFNLPSGGVERRIEVEQGTFPAATPTGVVTGTVTATGPITATAVPTATRAVTVTATPVMTGTPGLTATVPVTGTPLSGDGLTLSTGCAGGNCDFGVISAYLMDAPAGSRAGVQWLDPSGAWRNVEGWQGGSGSDGIGPQVQRWTVYPENFGQGPFRWVITQPNGTLWGIGPSFSLPNSGQNLVQFLRR